MNKENKDKITVLLTKNLAWQIVIDRGLIKMMMNF